MQNEYGIQELQQFVPDVTFELIPAKNLVSNQAYQRPLSRAQVQKLADDFDLFQINPVKVSRRNGVNNVMDGQHTIEGIVAASKSRETPVWCMVYRSMEYEEEADAFANQKKYSRPPTPYEIFVAHIEAGNDKYLLIRDVVESYQLKLSGKKVMGGVCAVATLELILDKFGYHVLDRTLRLCVKTWEGESQSLSANMLKGVAYLIVAFGDDLKDQQFIDKVGVNSAKDMVRNARERRAGTMGYAEAMFYAYNYRSKISLNQNKLYDIRYKNFDEEEAMRLGMVVDTLENEQMMDLISALGE